MKNLYLAPFIIFLAFIFAGCTDKSKKTDSKYSLIPMPKKITKHSGKFTIKSKTRIIVTAGNDEVKWIGSHMANQIGSATGYNIKVEESAGENKAIKNAIAFILDESIALKEEGYFLNITPKSIIITGKSPAGLFYGKQTLRQLLPAEIENTEPVKGISWTIPCVDIEDEPRFPYRGLHLDVGRHFFSKSFVKKYIELMALYKFNYFHWHLTEDQGWRIEIKKYPKLAEVAAYRNETIVGHHSDRPHQFDGQRYGGYYTQEDIKEIVDHAGKHYVTIVPEIEMPGHSQAALAAYPELGCAGGPYEVATRWGIFKEVYCAGNEKTFEFLEGVLTEVIELFPGKYIHIGGDECPKDRWNECDRCQARIKEEGLEDENELQSYFTKRIETFLLAHDRRLIGWDEILEGGLAPEATVMSWRGTKGGIEAAKLNHDVIMTPTHFCYFDYYQSKEKSGEPLAIGGFLPLDTVYSFEPVPDELTVEEAKHILGAQGNVWTEYIKTPEHVEYMAYPRACALAEAVWTPKENKNFNDFLKRMEEHYQRLNALNVNARHKE
jgi:hexosaminidase